VVIDWSHKDPWQGPGFAAALTYLEYEHEAEYGGVIFEDWRAANWHFISPNYVWAGLVQTEAAPEPEPEPEGTQKPAGRKRRRRRLLVEIDGQDFEVESVDEAVVLLDRAKEVAVAQIAQASAATVRVEHGIKRPSIRTDYDALRPLVRQKRAEIVALYDALLRDLEIQYLMAQADEEDEEETLIRFLM
jgi:hypothetical protein